MFKNLEALAAVALLAAVVACTEVQTAQVSIGGCTVWNQVEAAMIPKITSMTDTEYAIYEGAFTELSGGTLKKPAPARTAESGICRQKNLPTTTAVVDAVADAALRRIKPLVLKYTDVKY